MPIEYYNKVTKIDPDKIILEKKISGGKKHDEIQI